MNARRAHDSGLWDELRERAAREASTPPTYDEFLESRDLALGVTDLHERRSFPALRLVAACLAILVGIGLGRYLVPATTAPADTSVLSLPTRPHVLETPPTSDAGPECWISFQDGDLTGGCRDGTLRVIEYGLPTGGYVDGWNNDVSYVEVPAGWDVYTYHQMWDLGAAENSRRQGFLHHPGDSATDLQAGPHPIFRDPENLNWDYCRTWNQDLFDDGVSEPEELTDKNMQCIHIEPSLTDADTVLVVASDTSATTSRLEIQYQPTPTPTNEN